ncbi:MAG TPA: SCO family protein [Streptosporangiaceae bacterium]|nr:SCO family protein [Streptosporangiaceae bacterium]
MPGMHSGLNTANPVLVAAFRSALMHQGLVALLVLATLAIIWASLREWRPRFISAAAAGAARRASAAEQAPEHPARRLVRLGFGLIWVFDGILQAQPAMAAGLPSKVIAPAAGTSPAWVQHLVNWSGTAWSYHPVQASAAAVWIQVGIGVWMLAAARGPWSRLAGLASVGWGLLVWVFGEAFGGIFAPGLTILFGAPGAAVFYCIAGALVALPDRAWDSAALGRRLLAGLGVFFVAMAVLQAWPGRGFWQGAGHGQPGTLTGMVGQMSGTPQPALLARLVGDFGSFTASHGFSVNAFAVAALAIIGAGLLSQRRALLGPVLVAAVVFCLADWVLVEDLGFFGGLGTDPNSMIPLLLVLGCGYLALTRPRQAAEPEPEAAPELALAADGAPDIATTGPGAGPRWRDLVSPGRLAGLFAASSATGVLAVWAVGLVLLGAAPMAAAQASTSTASPIIAEALGGESSTLDVPATPFRLTDQNGRPVSLASLRGKVVLLTFLDPVCTTDCPLIAQELRVADQMLGPRAAHVEILAVAANPLYHTVPYLRAFDRQERLTGVANWHYLTASVSVLRRVWDSYGVQVEVVPGGQMVAHSDLVFVINGRGIIKTEFNADPGAGTASSKSSYAVLFAQAAERALSPGSGTPS